MMPDKDKDPPHGRHESPDRATVVSVGRGTGDHRHYARPGGPSSTICDSDNIPHNEGVDMEYVVGGARAPSWDRANAS